MQHADALLLAGRCGACAERAPRAAILRGRDCPSCDTALAWSSAGQLSQSLRSQMGWKRWLAYALVLAASFLTGLIPAVHVVLHPLLMLLALFVAHVWVVRHALRWLGPARRVTARLNLKLLAAALTCLNLVVNVAVAPLLSVASVPLAIFSVVLFALYLESALSMIGRRLEWEAAQEPLRTLEWSVPVGLLGMLLLTTVGGALGIWGLLYGLTEAEIPAISEFAAWFLGAED